MMLASAAFTVKDLVKSPYPLPVAGTPRRLVPAIPQFHRCLCERLVVRLALTGAFT